jgi:hypothetical protein
MNTTSEIATLRPVWTEAERKLYPLATVSPEKYQQVIRLAREVANGLAAVMSEAALAKQWANGETLVADAAGRIGVPVGDLPPESVAGVGFALRDAELRAAAHQVQLVSTIDAARSDGESWALLHEQGTLIHGLMDPYSAIQLHLATGAAIVSSVEPNPVDGQANHVLTVIRMNPDTGEPVDIDPGIADTQEHPEADVFLEARAALIEQIDSMT